jgi:hypothetical protein
MVAPHPFQLHIDTLDGVANQLKNRPLDKVLLEHDMMRRTVYAALLASNGEELVLDMSSVPNLEDVLPGISGGEDAKPGIIAALLAARERLCAMGGGKKK